MLSAPVVAAGLAVGGAVYLGMNRNAAGTASSGDPAEPEEAGANAAGPEVAGANAAGSEVAGANAAGPEVAGVDAAGAAANN